MRNVLRRSSRNDSGGLPTHGSSYSGSNGSFTSNSGSTFTSRWSCRGDSSSSGLRYSPSKRRTGGSTSSSTGAGSVWFMTMVGLGVFNLIVTGLWFTTRSRYQSILGRLDNARDKESAIDSIQTLRREIRNSQRDSRRNDKDVKRKYATQLSTLERENRAFQKERDDLRVKFEGPEKKEEAARLLRREQAFQLQIGRLQRATRKESKRSVLERFGPGPHEVQLTFVRDGNEYDIVIQLAPLDAVPHAVHLFLEQVEHGLWNNTYFYLNSDHVIQAGPAVVRDEEEILFEGEYVRSSVEPFSDVQLDSLSFPDYSHEFPHVEWTLGFAGRPGGPDFYINKNDNTEPHGPGGQFQHALEEQGDSCFGSIVRGKEHIRNFLFTAPLILDDTEWGDFYIDPIPIVRGIILTPKPAPGTKIVMGIPESVEIQFGRKLKDVLAPLEMTLIENPIITVEVGHEDANTNEHHHHHQQQ